MPEESARTDDVVVLADGSVLPAAVLAGAACVICGTATPCLVPAGTRHTRGADGRLVTWPVATCVAHITTVPQRTRTAAR